MRTGDLILRLARLEPKQHIAACLWTEQDIKDQAEGMNCFVIGKDLTDAEVYDIIDELQDQLDQAIAVDELITETVDKREVKQP